MFVPNTNLESSKTTDKPYENDREENVYVFKTTPATSLLPEVLNSILPTKPLEETTTMRTTTMATTTTSMANLLTV